ncbi:MAG: DUF192 domain-containing protein [Coriobacteriia bacterium]|nr:DUF192 domain-containing protein [Coriobacteriia bacterium]
MRAMRYTCVLLLAALGLAACSPDVADTVTIGGVEVSVIIADDARERSLGLQGHESLAPGEGMLFVFDDAEVRTFAMKEVAFPIDVVFIAEDLTVSAVEALDVGDVRLVSSPGPSPYVLELPQGWAEAQGIMVGSVVEVPD